MQDCLILSNCVFHCSYYINIFLAVLKARSDEAAVKFVKERQELYNKLLLVRDKITKRT